MITEKPFSRNPIKIIFFSSSRTKDNFSFSILVVLFLILRICLNKVIACGNPKTSRIYVLTIADLAFVESLFCYPLWIGTLQYQTSGVLCFISCHFSLQEYTRAGLSPEMLYCTVLFFFPPSLPPWVILRYVIGWQRGLLGISLNVVYFSFVFLTNFSVCQKANCYLFVSGVQLGNSK